MGDMKEVRPDPTVRLVKLDDVEDLKIMEAQLATDSAFGVKNLKIGGRSVMLERKDVERYERNARRILEALDIGKAPIDWKAIDEPELIQEIARELIRIDRDEGNK